MAFHGHCLLNGEFGMEPDEAEGIHWMGRAAHAGSQAAKSFLAQNGYASRAKRGRNKAPGAREPRSGHDIAAPYRLT
jgi:TPR repeat protein